MEGDLYAYHNEPKWRRRHITARWLSILFASWSQTNHHSLICLPRIEISGLPLPNSWRTNYFVCSIIASPCLTLTSSSLERSSTHCILTITFTEIKSHQISLRYKKIRNQHAVYSACLLSPTVYILNLFMHGCMRCSWLSDCARQFCVFWKVEEKLIIFGESKLGLIGSSMSFDLGSWTVLSLDSTGNFTLPYAYGTGESIPSAPKHTLTPGLSSWRHPSKHARKKKMWTIKMRNCLWKWACRWQMIYTVAKQGYLEIISTHH